MKTTVSDLGMARSSNHAKSRTGRDSATRVKLLVSYLGIYQSLTRPLTLLFYGGNTGFDWLNRRLWCDLIPAATRSRMATPCVTAKFQNRCNALDGSIGSRVDQVSVRA